MFWLLKMVKKINTHIFQRIVLTVKKIHRNIHESHSFDDYG